MAARSELRARISADSTQFRAEMGRVTHTAKSSAGEMARAFAGRINPAMLGAAGAAAGVALLTRGIREAVTATAKYGDEIGKASKRTGIGVEELQRLKHAADLSGADISSLETATKQMANALQMAGQGSKQYVDSLRVLGLSYEQLRGQSPDEQLRRIMEALAGVKDASTRAALAQDMFGRSGTQLLPMLSSGAAGLRTMREEADKLGLMTAKQVQAAEDFQDAMTRLGVAARSVRNDFGAVLLPTLTEIGNALAAVSAHARSSEVSIGHLLALTAGTMVPGRNPMAAEIVAGGVHESMTSFLSTLIPDIRKPKTTGMESEPDKWQVAYGQTENGQEKQKRQDGGPAVSMSRGYPARRPTERRAPTPPPPDTGPMQITAEQWKSATALRERAMREIRVAQETGDRAGLLLGRVLDTSTTEGVLRRLTAIGGGDIEAGWDILSAKVRQRVSSEQRYADNVRDAARQSADIAKQIADDLRTEREKEQRSTVDKELMAFFDPLDRYAAGLKEKPRRRQVRAGTMWEGPGGRMSFGSGRMSFGGVGSLGPGKLGFDRGGPMTFGVDRAALRVGVGDGRDTVSRDMRDSLQRIERTLDKRLPGGR